MFSSNGDAFLFHDKTVKSGNIETEIPLNAFPSLEQLWQKYKAFKGITDDIAPVVAQDYFSDGSNRAPRYYQQIAINRTVEAIARNSVPLPPLSAPAAIVARVETLLGSSRKLALELAHTRTHAAHLLQAVLKEAFTPAA